MNSKHCVENDVADLVYSSTLPFAVVGFLFVVLSASVTLGTGDRVSLAASILMAAVTAVRIIVSVRFWGARRQSVFVAEDWVWRYQIAAIPFASLLGLYGAYAFQRVEQEWQLPLVALLFAYPIGMIVRVAVRPAIAQRLLLLTMVPAGVSCSFVGTGEHAILAAFFLLYTLTATEMIRFLRRVIVGGMELQREKENLALSDDLTSLSNRRHFNHMLEALGGGEDPRIEPCALLLVDLDGFKEINDRHGHSMGDAVLKETAHRLKRAVRSSDRIARIGGDEFAVIMMPPVFPSDIENVAIRILADLDAPFRIDEMKLRLGASIGAATTHDGRRTRPLFDRADQALYEAKNAGRGRFSMAET